MTETEWLASTDSETMLEYLRGKISGRKVELFAWAIHDHACRIRNVDNKYEDDQLTVTHWHNHGLSTEFQLECPLAEPGEPRAWLYGMMRNDCSAPLLREIVGNPYRPVGFSFDTLVWGSGLPLSLLDESILPWQDGKIPKMATAIYNDRSFGDLPILADALEDAGCQNEEILRHCRGQERCSLCTFARAEWDLPIWCGLCKAGRGWLPLRGPHGRGCWVIDLLLGRN